MRKQISAVLVGVLLIQSLWMPCLAQEPLAIAPGSRVRIKAPSISKELLLGTVVSLGPDTLVVKPPRPWGTTPGTTRWVNLGSSVMPLVVPLDSVLKLEVLLREAKRMTLRDAGLGLIAGAAIGFATPPPEDDFYVLSRRFQAITLGIVGLVIGAVMARTVPTIWEPVPLERLRIGFTPNVNGASALSVSFVF